LIAEFEGIGGPQMIAEGFKSYYPMDILSVMGIVEVLKDIKKLFAVRDGLVDTWTKDPVDVFVGIDAPDFNLRLSKSLKQHNLPIKTVQYVSPSVWAWRQGRVHGIKVSIDLVLCLFPFEKAFYKQFDVPAAFVGHPLASQLPLINPLIEAKQELGLNVEHKHIALLPGSRRGEIERLGPLVLDAAKIISQKHLNGYRLAYIFWRLKPIKFDRVATKFSIIWSVFYLLNVSVTILHNCRIPITGSELWRIPNWRML